MSQTTIYLERLFQILYKYNIKLYKLCVDVNWVSTWHITQKSHRYVKK